MKLASVVVAIAGFAFVVGAHAGEAGDVSFSVLTKTASKSFEIAGETIVVNTVDSVEGDARTIVQMIGNKVVTTHVTAGTTSTTTVDLDVAYDLVEKFPQAASNIEQARAIMKDRQHKRFEVPATASATSTTCSSALNEFIAAADAVVDACVGTGVGGAIGCASAIMSYTSARSGLLKCLAREDQDGPVG